MDLNFGFQLWRVKSLEVIILILTKKKKNYKTEIQQLLETCKRTEVSGQTTPAKFRETGTSGEIQQLWSAYWAEVLGA